MVEALKKQQAEESVKLAYALAEIEILKNEVHLTQSEVASMTKRVETSNSHKKLVVKALEKANKENAVLKQWVGELSSNVYGLVEEMEIGTREAGSADSEVEKRFIANFYLTEHTKVLLSIGEGMPTPKWWNGLK